MRRRPFSWVGLVAIGLAGVVAVSAATAVSASSPASSFELVAIDRYEAECPDCIASGGHVGTFTSGTPFCASGTNDDLGSRRRGGSDVRYMCSDGSGSLTLVERNFGGGNANAEGRTWMIVEGSGAYADLRGNGSYSYEVLSEYPPAVVYRTTLRGIAGADAAAPSIAFTSALVTKLRRPAGSYSIRVALSLRDDVEGNPVAYVLRVREGREHARDRRRSELGRTEGTTASGSISTTLQVFPSSKRVRSVQLLLSASDPAGNEVSRTRSLKLPR
jgi:hypothetical protein